MLARVMRAARHPAVTARRAAVRSFWPGLVGLWLAVGLQTATAAEPAGLLRDFGREQLLLSTAAKGCTLIDVYVAATAQQRAQGLMHVREMGRHEGMVFIYPRQDVIRMWMKNTWLPLDMLFVDESGRIVHVHRDAKPHDETVISSGEPVSYVVELNAGSAELFGVKAGDRIDFPAP